MARRIKRTRGTDAQEAAMATLDANIARKNEEIAQAMARKDSGSMKRDTDSASRTGLRGNLPRMRGT